MNLPQEHRCNQAYRDAIQLNLPFVANEPLLYLDAGDRGYFSIFYKSEDFHQQRSYPLRMLPLQLKTIRTDVDSYICQNEFYKPNRRAVNLLRSNVCFADLDTYNTDLKGLSPEKQAGRILSFCYEKNIPIPSLLVYSGNGFYAKWLFDKPMPRIAVPRWKTLQDYICKKFEPFGADPKAKLVSQILRPENTINHKTGNRVQLFYTDGCFDNPTRPNVETLCNAFMPYTRQEIEGFKKAAQERTLRKLEGKSPDKRLRRFLAQENREWWERLNWDYLEDLRNLVRLRWENYGVPRGKRNHYLGLAAVFISWVIQEPGQFYLELQSIARELVPDVPMEVVRNKTSTIYRRTVEAFKGQKCEPRYKYKTETLLNQLQVEPAEEKNLLRICSKETKKERTLEKDRKRKQAERRDAGMMERPFYERRAASRKEKARELYGQGKRKEEIANILDVSVETVSTYLFR